MWKTPCYKNKISWFDFWQLRNNPAVFSFPKLPAVQLKMEMIYVPQNPADWQAVQEGVLEPHCAMAPLEQWEGKRADHRDAPPAGIRDISLPKSWAVHAQAWKRAGLWFLVKFKRKCTTPKGLSSPDLYPEVDVMVDYICSSHRKQSDSSVTQCICTLVSGG